MQWGSVSHPISDVWDWSKNNRLELQPDFQRLEVWSEAAKVMLIDTILRQIPIPKIYLKSIIKDDNTYRIVIDGQQRLTSILDFLNNKFPLSKTYEGEFKDLYFVDLPDEVRNNILTYKIDINEIVNPTDDEVRDLYSRVNKYTVQLNKQELRRADYPGEFIKLAEELANHPFFEDSKIFSVKMRRRMLDVEYIEELLAIQLDSIQDKKDTIDIFCENYRIFPSGYENEKNKFLLVIEDIIQIFSNDLHIESSRFKQKSDFYCVFAAITNLHKNNYHLDKDEIPKIQEILDELNEKIEPNSDESEFREYAIRCISDANSVASREWRTNYLLNFIKWAYKKEVQ